MQMAMMVTSALSVVFMPSPPDSVSKGVMFSGCLSVRLFLCSSGQILLLQYLMNGLSSLDETYRQYSLASTVYLIRFWRSKVKVTAGR